MYSRYHRLSIVRAGRWFGDAGSPGRAIIETIFTIQIRQLSNISRKLDLCKEKTPDASYSDFQIRPMPGAPGAA
jgi:hypothetical protein